MLPVSDPHGVLDVIARAHSYPVAEWVKMLESLPQKEQAQIQHTYRINCEQNVLFLAREVLHYDWVEYNLQYHQELAKQAMYLGDTLTLAPRSFIKSTIITKAGTIWYLLTHKEHCVLLVSNSKDNAKQHLKGITEHFTRNLLFRWVFFDFCPLEPKEDPTAEKYVIPSRSCVGRPEPSIGIAGIDTSQAGRHYDRIVGDDIVHEINVPPKGSVEAMNTVFQQFQDMDSLLKTGVQDNVVPHKTVVGTRWHDGDTYGRILHPDEDMYDLFEVLIAEPYGNMWRNCDNRDEARTWNGGGRIRSSEEGVLWESKYPKHYLDTLRRKRGSYHWACNMAQDPLPPDSATRFDSSWFHRFDLEEYNTHPEHYSTAITVDGAFTEDAGKKSDRTAIIVSAIRYDGTPFLLAVTAGKFRPSQIVDKAISYFLEWKHCEWIGVECDSGGRAIYNDLKDEVETRGLDIWVRDLWTGGMKKDARVNRLLTRVERRGLYYHDGIKQEYINEIIRYGVARYRDIPDALAYRILDSDVPDKPVVPVAVSREYIPKRITGQDVLDRLERTSIFSPWGWN